MKLIVMPMLGEVKKERITSLSSCHALWERQVVKHFETPRQLVEALAAALREQAIAQRPEALINRKLTFIVEMEV